MNSQIYIRDTWLYPFKSIEIPSNTNIKTKTNQNQLFAYIYK